MKNRRQAKIMEIISGSNVETQEQLLALLQQEGFRVTQATISRDIKDLRIVKELTSLGTYRYAASTSESRNSFTSRLNAIFKECVVSFDYAQNIIVVRTMPGFASAAVGLYSPPVTWGLCPISPSNSSTRAVSSFLFIYPLL